MQHSIPNVSSIYRELISINNPTNSNVVKHGNVRSQSQRQRQHDQLMERFRKSKLEHQQLLHGSDPYADTSGTSFYNYDGGLYSSTFSSIRLTESVKPKWQPPLIRYRHIEDQKQQIKTEVFSNNGSPPQTSNPKEAIVQYSQNQATNTASRVLDYARKSTSVPEQQQKTTKAIDTCPITNIPGNREQHTKSDMKYEDKLESYYDLCLKRPPQPKNNESKDISTKFVRKSGQKSNTSDLAKAMRLLEAD